MAEQYYLPFSALSLADSLKSKGYDVLLIFDDVYEHFLQEYNIFNTINLPFSPISILKELFTAAGVFKYEGGSLSCLLCFDEN